MQRDQIPQYEVQARLFQNVLLETYRYAPGSPEYSPPHTHTEYQFCLSLDCPGLYHYRRAMHSVPAGSLSILHPGEVHSSRDPDERTTATHFRLFYFPPEMMHQIACAAGNRVEFMPFFATPILTDMDLFQRFCRLHRLLESKAPQLEQETALHTLLADLIFRQATGTREPPSLRQERVYVRQTRDYIEAHLTQNVSLTELAENAGVTPFYLNRVFQAEVGIPPHLYQTQIRIERARRLLAQGLPVGQVAQEVGFYDQSHFVRHFKRWVKVSPSQYASARTYKT
jgi:AraC-like DNA-binding protein